MTLQRIHLLAGISGLLAFLATGVYMGATSLPEMADAPRLFVRSAHSYIFWSALANLLLASYWQRFATGLQRHAQTLGSCLLLLALPMLFTAFWQPYAPGLDRSLIQLATMVSLGGGVLHALAALYFRPAGTGGSDNPGPN